MSYSVSVTRSGGGAVAVTRSDSGVKVVVAGGLGSLVSIAQAAADSAETDAAAAAASALAASGSASAAASSATDAQTAQTAAELAETHAETAETNAETAQGLAEAAQAAAEAAQAAAEAAQAGAETAETNAETAETHAETAQAAAEAAQAAAEAAAATITLPLPIASGGTAATDAAGARANLSAAKSGANTDITSAYLDNTGLKIKDPDGSNGLTLVAGSNLSADRTLTFLTGNASRNLTMSGNADISGTNTGDQTITLTGDVTGTGAGSFAATIANDAVTFAKMQNIATDTLIGRDTASTGDPEVISVGGGLEFTGSAGIQRSALTGDVTASAGSNATTIPARTVTLAKMANLATDRLIGRDTTGTGVPEALTVGGGVEFSGSGGVQRSALTGDVTASAGSNATTIANDAVTYAKMQNISATSRILGRKTASAGDPEECTLSELLDFIGSAARGDILYRGASAWARLAAGTSGQLLQTGGAAGDPSWAAYPTIVSLEGLSLVSGDILYATAADTLARLPKGTDGQWLKLASGIPSWAFSTTPTVQVFTGSTTWNRPAGCRGVKVTVVAGGGGGGGADGSSGSGVAAGGGGGGGGHAIEFIDVSAISSASVVVGAGGTAGSNSGGNGGTGGTSSFGTGPLLQATGGAGGTGVQESGTQGGRAGGAGGVGSSGDVNGSGGAGANSIYSGSNFSTGGTGGSSFMGGGGLSALRTTSGSTAGGDGGVFGGGGGGAASMTTTSGAAGGAGAGGVVIVEEYYG